MQEKPTAADAIKREMLGILAFIGVIWLVFLVDFVTPIEKLALVPRTLTGLAGIVTMPLLHKDLGHILSNTVPLFVLLTLLAGSRSNSWQVVGMIVLLSGTMLWTLGFDNRAHVGASGLVFGLIAFLVSSGVFERRLVSIGIAILVGLLYGTTFLFGLLPLREGVSWEGHLYGGLAGVLVAYGCAAASRKRRLAVSTQPTDA